MTKKKRKAGDYMLFVVGILFISFLVNVLLSVKNYKANYMVGKEAYRSIENVRVTNDSNIKLLKDAIDIGAISNMDLLKLYKNFSDISDVNMILWNNYVLYEEDKSILGRKKKIENNGDILTDINIKVQEYLLAILDREMQTQSYKLKLEGEALENFKMMEQLASDVNFYFQTLYDNNGLSELEGDERIKKFAKNNYWIDVLEGINQINYGYVNKTFVLE